MELGLGTAWFGKIPFSERRNRILELFNVCRDEGINYVDTGHSYFWGFAEGLVRWGISQTSCWEPDVATKIGLRSFKKMAEGGPRSAETEPAILPGVLSAALRKDLRISCHRLGAVGPSTLLLHCPPSAATTNPEVWDMLEEFAGSRGVEKIGFSINRMLSSSEVASIPSGSVIQVAAKHFLGNNEVFADLARSQEFTVVVHRIIELGEDFNENLSLLVRQKKRPDIALAGTTSVSRLKNICLHWRDFRGAGYL